MFAPVIPLEQRLFGPLIAERAQRHPHRAYLSDHTGRSWTYGAFFTAAQSLAKGLASHGVKAQEPVILLMQNEGEFVIAHWGLTFLNAIAVPTNTALSGAALAYVFKDTGARTVIADAALLDNLAATAAAGLVELDLVVAVGPAAKAPIPTLKKVVPFDAMLAGHASAAVLCRPAAFDDIHLIAYTSGTTGPSKGVQVTYAQSVHTSLACIDAVGLTADDCIYAPLPLFHGMSRTMGTAPAMLHGARVHVADRFSATRFWEDVRSVGATYAVTVFTVPPTLKAKPASPLDRQHSLRVMFNAHHDREFEDRFGVRIVEAHGMTELGITIYSPHGERREGAAGRAAPEWDVMVVDEHDREVPPGAIGEMVARPQLPAIMMRGYLNKPEATAVATRNLWFHSGDFMRRDADGFFFFAGRSKERIRRRGENISAYEIEIAVNQHPGIVESAAVPYPAPGGEDDVRLVAVRRDGTAPSAADLGQWLESRLPRYMLPRYVEFRSELPRTASGKLEKASLVDSTLGAGCWDREATPLPEGKSLPTH